MKLWNPFKKKLKTKLVGDIQLYPWENAMYMKLENSIKPVGDLDYMDNYSGHTHPDNIIEMLPGAAEPSAFQVDKIFESLTSDDVVKVQLILYNNNKIDTKPDKFVGTYILSKYHKQGDWDIFYMTNWKE